jgi:hypothetical protein
MFHLWQEKLNKEFATKTRGHEVFTKKKVRKEKKQPRRHKGTKCSQKK